MRSVILILALLCIAALVAGQEEVTSKGSTFHQKERDREASFSPETISSKGSKSLQKPPSRPPHEKPERPQRPPHEKPERGNKYGDYEKHGYEPPREEECEKPCEEHECKKECKKTPPSTSLPGVLPPPLPVVEQECPFGRFPDCELIHDITVTPPHHDSYRSKGERPSEHHDSYDSPRHGDSYGSPRHHDSYGRPPQVSNCISIALLLDLGRYDPTATDRNCWVNEPDGIPDWLQYHSDCGRYPDFLRQRTPYPNPEDPDDLIVSCVPDMFRIPVHDTVADVFMVRSLLPEDVAEDERLPVWLTVSNVRETEAVSVGPDWVRATGPERECAFWTQSATTYGAPLWDYKKYLCEHDGCTCDAECKEGACIPVGEELPGEDDDDKHHDKNHGSKDPPSRGKSTGRSRGHR